MSKGMFLVVYLSLMSLRGYAETRLSLEFGATQESRNTTDIKDHTRDNIDFNASFSLNKKYPVYLCLGYLVSNKVENLINSEYNSFSSSNIYAGVGYDFFAKKSYSLRLMVAYSPMSKFEYSQSAGKDRWEGSALIFKSGVSGQLLNSLSLNFYVTYIQESYSKKLSGTQLNQTTFNQNYLVPSVGIDYSF